MSAAPRVTVVTPSLNQAPFLEEALHSVLDQGYPNLEYLVLDAGSTDGSADIIRKHAQHLSFWRSAPDNGQSDALREGFRMATGDILTWLNSDDMLAEGALQAVADAWTQHGPNVIVAGGCQLIDNNTPKGIHYPRFQRRFGYPELIPLERILDLPRYWIQGEFFYQPEVFFPADAYDRVGGIDSSFYFTMDYDLWARFALAQVPVVVLERPLALYREHDNQKTNAKQPLYAELIETANKYLLSGRVDIPQESRERIARRNLRAKSPMVREGWKLIRRAQGWFGAQV